MTIATTRSLCPNHLSGRHVWRGDVCRHCGAQRGRLVPLAARQDPLAHGYDSCVNGRDVLANPFPEQSEDWSLWAQGFNDALADQKKQAVA